MATVIQNSVVNSMTQGLNTIQMSPTKAGNSLVFIGLFDNGTSPVSQLTLPTDNQNLVFRRVTPDIVEPGGIGGLSNYSAMMCCLAAGTHAASEFITFYSPTNSTVLGAIIYEVSGTLVFGGSNSNFSANPNSSSFSTGVISPVSSSDFEVAAFSSLSPANVFYGNASTSSGWGASTDAGGGSSPGYSVALADNDTGAGGTTQSEPACIFTVSANMSEYTTAAIWSFHNRIQINGIGFVPSYYYDSYQAGLSIYVASGVIGGVQHNGQVVTVPPNAQTYVWVDATGTAQTGTSLGDGYPVALVTSGQIRTSGSGSGFAVGNPPSSGAVIFSDGITSIVDITIK